MKRRILPALFALIAGVSACSTTGGTSSVIKPTPKFTMGELVDGIYYARDLSFSIAVPHAVGTYEYDYMQIEESPREGGWSVGFGPAGLDETIFRVDVAARDPATMAVPIADFAEPLFDRSLTAVEATYGSEAVRAKTMEVTVAGHSAIFSTYVQRIYEQKKTFGGRIAEGTRVHAMYLLDCGPWIATVWVAIPVAERASVPEIEAAVLAGHYEPVKCFVESIMIPAPAPDLPGTDGT